MAKNQKLPTNAQAAAVRAMVAEGKTLEDIKKQFPDLDDGVKLVTGEQEKPKSRGSGPSHSLTMNRPAF